MKIITILQLTFIIFVLISHTGSILVLYWYTISSGIKVAFPFISHSFLLALSPNPTCLFPRTRPPSPPLPYLLSPHPTPSPLPSPSMCVWHTPRASHNPTHPTPPPPTHHPDPYRRSLKGRQLLQSLWVPTPGVLPALITGPRTPGPPWRTPGRADSSFLMGFRWNIICLETGYDQDPRRRPCGEHRAARTGRGWVTGDTGAIWSGAAHYLHISSS